MGTLDGKVAIVTGAARGQGEAEARLFVAEGAKVMLTDVLPEGAAVAEALGDLAAFSTHDDSSARDACSGRRLDHQYFVGRGTEGRAQYAGLRHHQVGAARDDQVCCAGTCRRSHPGQLDPSGCDRDADAE